MILRGTAALALAVALAACGGSTTEPEEDPPEIEVPAPDPPDPPEPPAPPNPGPTKIVIVTATKQSDGDVVTSLDNQGGPGSYQLEFWGSRLNQPSGTCAPTFLGETDVIPIDADYAETLEWNTGDGGDTVHRVVAFSRPQNSAAWSETSRHSFC